MCDLIDLNSPDSRKLTSARLASPLIPGPSILSNNEPQETESVAFVCQGKRSSLENNPFDKVFKQTADYMAKKDDPFEAVMEKARLQTEVRKCPAKHGDSSRHKEDFTPKRRRHSDVLKANKTLDEPLLEGLLNRNLNRLIHSSQAPSTDNSFVKDLNDTDLLADDHVPFSGPATVWKNSDCSKSLNIIVHPPSPQNRSVLNQSAMNDSLSEVSKSSVENEQKDNVIDKIRNTLDLGRELDSEPLRTLGTDLAIKQSKQRSFSQSNKSTKFVLDTDETLLRPRSRSIVDTLRARDVYGTVRGSPASSLSSGPIDFVNNAFIETSSSTNSELFDLSRISATPRPAYDSYSSVASSYSNNSKNQAFLLDSQSSGRIFGSGSTVKSSLNLSSISRLAVCNGNQLISTPLKTPVSTADLELRLQKIKLQSAGSIGALPLYSPNRKVQSYLQYDAHDNANRGIESSHLYEQQRNIKLVDADIFEPLLEIPSYDSGRTNTDSNCSSDSVFIDNGQGNQSVFKEARLLAQTFREIAQQSGSTSFSSGDDLLYSIPRWNFDVLPPSDDEEIQIENLIELPVSPAKDRPNVDANQNEEVHETVTGKSTSCEVSEDIKKLETEFINEDGVRNKGLAVTLLLDLEKIIHKENNPEAIRLLESLEKVLGVKCESNAELLATCMQETNNLSKSPNKYATKLGSNENIKHECLEKSHEDNDDAGLSNGVKMLEINNDENLGINLNNEKSINKSEKSIITDFSSVVVKQNENLEEKLQNNLLTSRSDENQSSVDQTEALDLITNLSKILGGQKSDSSPLSLLINLRQVLNLATSQLNFENAQIKKSQSQESPNKVPSTPDTQKKLMAKQKPKAKLVHQKSMESSVKIQATVPNTAKRSMSFGNTQRNVFSTGSMSNDKTKSSSRGIQKALSCGAVPKPDSFEKPSSVAPAVSEGRVSVISETAKYKLKKKSESESVAGKKGPLKALIPVGSMQRRGSLSMKVHPITVSRTPPKSSSKGPSTFIAAGSSTPNATVALTCSKKTPKTKPMASSTPDGAASKTRKVRLQLSTNVAKPKFSCNISPVTPAPTYNITARNGSKSSTRSHGQRHNRTMSPPKKRDSLEYHALNTTESSIPKYSPQVGFLRRNSKDVDKKLETSGSPKSSSAKLQTPKKSPFIHNKSTSLSQSPLKTVNNQNAKFKPFNLISKLRRGSSGSSVADKENCA